MENSKKNNTLIIQGSIVFSIIVAIMVFTCCSDGKSPAIYIDGEKYKFGKVKEGRDVVFTFFFKNTGTKDLVIKELDVSCFCVVVKEYDKVVKPGERGKIYGVIETKGFQGNITKAIKITTNIPGREPDILTLEGTILPGQE